MMRKVGLEADSGVRRVILLQGFATRSLQFNIFLTAIIWLYTTLASIMFSHRKKSLRRFELKDKGRCVRLFALIELLRYAEQPMRGNLGKPVRYRRAIWCWQNPSMNLGRFLQQQGAGRCAFLYGRLAEKWRTLSPSSHRHRTNDHSA